MLDTRSIVDYFESAAFQEHVAESRALLDAPLSDRAIDEAISTLPGEVRNEMKFLLSVSSGVSIHPVWSKRKTRVEDSSASMSFVPECGKGNVWPNVYPSACQGGVGEELLYWDICGDPAGRVFSVCHDGPWHCMAYENLVDLIQDMVQTEPEDCFDRVYSKARYPPKAPQAEQFSDDDEDLVAFVKQFPAKYRVHDLRQAASGAAFLYGVLGPQGFSRWMNRHVWVERMPETWWEAVRWWWKTPV